MIGSAAAQTIVALTGILTTDKAWLSPLAGGPLPSGPP